MKRIIFALSLFAAVPLIAQSPAATRRPSRPTVAEAERFIAGVERDLAEKSLKSSRAGWVAANFITDDTEEMSADAQRAYSVAVQQYALQASRFDRLKLPAMLGRKLMLLKLALSAPPPSNPTEATELVRLGVGLEAEYGKGRYCRAAKEAGKPEECLQINDLSRILATSRDPNELLEAWTGWHTISRQMRPRYARFVELSNKGSRELGFANTGAMWRAGYDMDPDAFSAELERIWKQVEPLYLSLHAYTRAKLVEKYGASVVPPNGMIPGHLLGNMWAQEWGNIYEIVAPAGVPRGYDVTELLKARNVDARGMVKYGESFFTSLGFAPLPETFWKRSLLVKPRDREVVCHASAWDIDSRDDIRIKACFEPNAEDFVTAHHELGHSFYQRAYKNQPFLLQNGANDGFHEAIGDAVALSINSTYLKQVGLLDNPPSAAGDTAFLLRQAMDKVAFLPFGLLIDQWRWKVFSGEVKPADYNKAWWDLRNKYQGVSAPVARTEADFDPGAKFHIPGNTPYTRYFLARVLQFQFYRAMCREAGHTGPLYTCSFYNSKAAGARLARMLESGQSVPWQETLFTMTGERQMDGNALLEYFQPLKVWLDRQNQGKPVGWSVAAGR
ncbi:MAG: M2 family metallopeptidase [Gemmatimonadaceae bacterium]|nr:M2 family metallopeptidase [Gemmatimonadaceae bacterium]